MCDVNTLLSEGAHSLIINKTVFTNNAQKNLRINKTKGERYMFERLFGPTEEMQLDYLQKRVVITVIAFVIAIIGSLFYPEAIALLALVALVIWGWGATTSIFGFVLENLFDDRNPAIGIVLLFLALFVAYILGIIVGVIGIIRYIQLKIKFSKQVAR